MRRRARLAVLLALLALVGCGSGGDGPAGVPDPSHWVTTTKARTGGGVGHVTWDLPYGEPSSLDWLHAAAPSENTVLANLCEGLLRTDPSGRPELALASSMREVTPTRWVFALRSGVRFWDGKPLTAADAVASLKRNLVAENASFWATWFGAVRAIRATGPRELTIELRHPDALLPQFLATAAGVVAQRDFVAHAGAAYGTPTGGVMCTGPYELDRWTPGKGIRTLRNPSYWDPAHQPLVDRIDYAFVTNPSAVVAGLRSGELDGAYETPVGAAGALRRDAPGTLHLGRSTSFASLAFTARPGPVAGVRVRHALGVALDRDAIARTIFRGTAAPIRSYVFEASWGEGAAVYRGFDASAQVATTGDLEAARRLLRGVKIGRPLRVLGNADDVATVQLGQYLRSVAAKLGLRVRTTNLPAAQYIAAQFDPRRQAQYDVLITDIAYYDVTDPLELAVLSLAPGAPFNTSGYADPQTLRLLGQATATTDPEDRARLTVRIERRAGREWRSVPLVTTASRLFLNHRLTGVPASLLGHLYYPWAADLGAAG